MSFSFSRRIFTVALLGAVMVQARQREERCDFCDRVLPQKYWNYEGYKCCSEACVDEFRPLCCKCEKVIRGKYIESDGKIYCSQKCFNTTLPRCEICGGAIHEGYSITRHNYCEQCINNSPTCFSCGLPAAHPTELSDGRILCHTCRRWEVSTQEMALKHYDIARRQLEAWTGLQIQSIPELKLVDRDEMNKLSGDLRKSDSPVSIRGLYSRQTMLIKRGIFGAWKSSPEQSKETIYIIDHLHDETFRVAATHELMHDLMHEHFPRLEKAPLWVHEGICQQAAAEYCRRRNYPDSLDSIETCKDPDYGDGYRYVNNLMGFNGWQGLKRWMDTVDVDSLPEKAPSPEEHP
ncbi:hypothetical protein P4B35_13865 [Pontiellaceae bacterium B12227]|nr:hypothetical protein [Pontiellaceae bacterium B12227]